MRGSWALIVGASEGIGAAFAEELAARGGNIVAVARREPPLEALAGRLARHGVQVRVAALDAATPEGIATLADAPEDIGLLVCNAALAPVGPFLDLSTAQLDAMLDLNCRAAVRLAHAYGRRMVARGGGGIVLLGSLAGYQGSAVVTHYAATKAYLRVLAEGLWAELGPQGVDVIAACPGPVDTPTFAASRPAGAGRLASTPGQVARETLAALGRQPVVIPGRWNRLAALAMTRLLPRRGAVRLVSARTRAMYPTESRRPVREDGRDP